MPHRLILSWFPMESPWWQSEEWLRKVFLMQTFILWVVKLYNFPFKSFEIFQEAASNWNHIQSSTSHRLLVQIFFQTFHALIVTSPAGRHSTWFQANQILQCADFLRICTSFWSLVGDDGSECRHVAKLCTGADLGLHHHLPRWPLFGLWWKQWWHGGCFCGRRSRGSITCGSWTSQRLCACDISKKSKTTWSAWRT